MTFTITWNMIQWAGLFLFLLSLLALICGDLPDHEGSRLGNGFRWVAWPLMAIWIIGMLVKGIFF